MHTSGRHSTHNWWCHDATNRVYCLNRLLSKGRSTIKWRVAAQNAYLQGTLDTQLARLCLDFIKRSTERRRRRSRRWRSWRWRSWRRPNPEVASWIGFIILVINVHVDTKVGVLDRHALKNCRGGFNRASSLACSTIVSTPMMRRTLIEHKLAVHVIDVSVKTQCFVRMFSQVGAWRAFRHLPKTEQV